MPEKGGQVTQTARRDASNVTDYDAANTFDEAHLEAFGKFARDSHLLEYEALVHGLDTMRVSPLVFTSWAPGAQRRIGFYRSACDANSRVAALATGNKQLTRTLLARAGVAIPRGREFGPGERKRAAEYARSLGWPVVVKPLAAAGGAGVTSGIKSRSQLRWALNLIPDDTSFIVEEHVAGEDYRFIVLDDRVISVLHCRRASVVGDGVSTVSELIENRNRVRQARHPLQGAPIKFDRRAGFQLKRQGLRPNSVPAAGRRVTLSTNGNLGFGGDSVQVLHETHPSLLDMAVRARRALPGISYTGLDLLIEDHRLPVDKQSASICEANSYPVNAAHHFPMFGQPRNVSRELFLAHCERVGVPLDETRDRLCLDLEIRGDVRGVGYRRWLAEEAGKLGLSGWARNGAGRKQVDARVCGPGPLVTALVSRAVVGPPESRVSYVRTRHSEGNRPGGEFTVDDITA